MRPSAKPALDRREGFVDQAIDEPDCTIIDQVIDETHREPRTRAQQRDATRQGILDATVACLIEDGYSSLTTRKVAERAQVAQSTLMHHFPAREALLVEAVTTLATSLAQRAVSEIDLAAANDERHRSVVLDQAWRTFTSPEAMAAIQLWGAAWAEPELAVALHEFEGRVTELVMAAAQVVFPVESEHPDFPVLIDTVVQVIRGLVMAIPTAGRDAIDARWSAIKPVLIKAAASIVDA